MNGNSSDIFLEDVRLIAKDLNDFYDELEFAIIGKLYNEKYQLGRSVRIRVRSVSLEKRRADFDLVD